MEAKMSGDQGLILVLYAGFAGILLLAGFIYKEIRAYKERRKTSKLKFDVKPKNEEVHSF
jgi:hypothetical protein